MKKTKKYWKTVIIQEFYTKEKGKVYYHWRFGNGKWNKDLTPFKEFPIIEVKLSEDSIMLVV
jgi:hypothetical protein